MLQSNLFKYSNIGQLPLEICRIFNHISVIANCGDKCSDLYHKGRRRIWIFNQFKKCGQFYKITLWHFYNFILWIAFNQCLKLVYIKIKVPD